MKDKSQREAEVRTFVEQNSAWHIWLLTYTSTHHLLVLKFHQGDCMKGTKIACADCSFISGKTTGGPYKIEVTSADRVRLRGVGESGEFLVECGMIEMYRG